MTINQQVLQGKWNEIKGSVRERWGEISQDDLQRTKGNVEQLVGLIQRETGEAREHVETFLAELTDNGGAVLTRATEAAKEYASQAADRLGNVKQQAAASLNSGYEQTEKFVRNRPVESLVACFGTGLIAGLVIGLVSRSK